METEEKNVKMYEEMFILIHKMYDEAVKRQPV